MSPWHYVLHVTFLVERRVAAVSRARSNYEPWQVELVRDAYPGCTSRADKLALVDRAGLGGLPQLYQLAARLGVTRKQLDFDPVTGTYIEFDYSTPPASLASSVSA